VTPAERNRLLKATRRYLAAAATFNLACQHDDIECEHAQEVDDALDKWQQLVGHAFAEPEDVAPLLLRVLT
jgi:hypothetical protein